MRQWLVKVGSFSKRWIERILVYGLALAFIVLVGNEWIGYCTATDEERYERLCETEGC